MSDSTSLIRAQEIQWRREYSENASLVLDRCTVSLKKGTWTALIGPNGAGKSTLLQVLSGVLGYPSRLFQGKIFWGDSDWRQLSPRERASRLAYLGSEFDSVFPVTVEEAIRSGAFVSGREDLIGPALEFSDLMGLRSRSLDRLSGGERQRVALARSLVQGAEVLFLDESLSKMDPDYQQSFGSKIQALIRGSSPKIFEVSAIVSVSHDLNFAWRWADHAWVLARGKIVGSGVIGEVLTESLFQQIYPNVAPKFLIQK